MAKARTEVITLKRDNRFFSSNPVLKDRSSNPSGKPRERGLYDQFHTYSWSYDKISVPAEYAAIFYFLRALTVALITLLWAASACRAAL